MKILLAFGVSVLSLAASPAQVRVPSPSTPPLVSSNASSRPLGGVALPTFPARPLAHRGKGARTQPSRYIGPVYYVPNAFDAGFDYGSDSAPEPPLEAPAPPHNFRMRPRMDPGTAAMDPAAVDPGAVDEAAPPPPENYYLIAYKNHTVYPALSYWIDGQTLHYLTTDNTHNQASIAFIDVEQTTRLNADRTVPFILPSR